MLGLGRAVEEAPAVFKEAAEDLCLTHVVAHLRKPVNARVEALERYVTGAHLEFGELCEEERVRQARSAALHLLVALCVVEELFPHAPHDLLPKAFHTQREDRYEPPKVRNQPVVLVPVLEHLVHQRRAVLPRVQIAELLGDLIHNLLVLAAQELLHDLLHSPCVGCTQRVTPLL